MKVLVVGGSNGIGLSLVLAFATRGDCDAIYVLDKQPFPDCYAHSKIHYFECNLTQADYSVLNHMHDIDALYITAGFGHLQYFQDLSQAYIQDSFLVNALAPIQIIRHYYNHLLRDDKFYCAVMVSIAGRLCSPLFSVYSATKAALSKFIEAVNVELEVQGSQNRILEVSPGSLKGTSFSGGISDPSQTASMASEIISHTEHRETLFIPQYETVFQSVIERYHTDAHQFGLDSYAYKQQRMNNK